VKVENEREERGRNERTGERNCDVRGVGTGGVLGGSQDEKEQSFANSNFTLKTDQKVTNRSGLYFVDFYRRFIRVYFFIHF
jgi:hypothetical protein